MGEAFTPETRGAELLRIGVVLVVVALALQTVAHLSNEFLLDERFPGLNADEEGNAFTWASSVSTFALGMAAFLHAVVFSELRREFSLLAGLAVLFSLDDAVQLHERLTVEIGEDLLGLPDNLAGRLWVGIYFPLLVLTGWLLWTIARQVWDPAARMVRLGLVLLVTSILAEFPGAVTERLDEEETSGLGDLLVALEEGLELAGWMLAAVGLTTAVAVSLMRYGAASAAR